MSAIILAFTVAAIVLVIRWEVNSEKTSRDDSFGGIFAMKKTDKHNK